MSPKEKAEELIEQYITVRWDIDPDTAKQCALIAVDEILDSNMIHLHLHQMDYWEEVKTEIEKL